MKKLTALLLLVALVLTAAGCSISRSNYSASKPGAAFRAEFETWTGKDGDTFQLEAGDTLHVEWKLEKGTMDIQIAVPGQEPVYTANGLTAENDPRASFKVTVPEAGEYRLFITAKQTTGSVEFRK